jgi:hypothetical protein
MANLTAGRKGDASFSDDPKERSLCRATVKGPRYALGLWLGFLLLTGTGQGNCQIDRASQEEIMRTIRQSVLSNMPPLPQVPPLPRVPKPPGVGGQSNGLEGDIIPRPAIPVPSAAPDNAVLIYGKRMLEDHRTNVQLWAEVRRARVSGDPRQVSAAEQALADYLSARLARIYGKTNPPGASLAVILKEYRALRGRGSTRRRWGLVALATVAVAPLAVFAVHRLRGRRLRVRPPDPA